MRRRKWPIPIFRYPEIRVTSSLHTIAFYAAYLRKRPASPEELSRDRFLRQQEAAIRTWCSANQRKIARAFTFASTSRATPFTRSEPFVKAMAAAQEHDYPLILGSVVLLLAQTPKNLQSECIGGLDASPVDIVDAIASVTWQSMPDTAKRQLITHAEVIRSSRSRVKKNTGIGRDASTAPRGSTEGRRRGAKTNAMKADKRAKELAAFVNAERAKLPDGFALTPTVLREALNAAGILTPKGKAYTFNAVKNLLARVDRIGAVSATD